MRNFLPLIPLVWFAGILAGHRAFSLDMIAWLIIWLVAVGLLLGFIKIMRWINPIYGDYTDRAYGDFPDEFDGFTTVPIYTDLTPGAGIDHQNPITGG